MSFSTPQTTAAPKAAARLGDLRALRWLAVWLAIVAATTGTAQGQAATPPPADAQTPAESTTSAPGMVRLNFPNEIELKGFVDYVSQRLGVKILYDEQISNKKISIKAPGEIPADSLLDLLQSALRIKGLALIDAEVPGWKRIVVGAKLSEIAPAAEGEQGIHQFGTGSPVTQAFPLKHVDSQVADQAIKPFLSQPGASSIAIKEPRLLIVTDYANNLQKIAKWIEMIDRPKSDVSLRFVPAQNVESAALAQQLTAILAAKAKAQGAAGAGAVP